MKFFSLEAILCVSHITFNEKIIFLLSQSIPSKSSICPKHHAHSLPPIWVFTLTTTLRGLPERWRLAHIGCSKLAYNGIYPDGRPSRPTAYTGEAPDSDSAGSLLKNRSSPTSDARSQPIMGYTLISPVRTRLMIL